MKFQKSGLIAAAIVALTVGSNAYAQQGDIVFLVDESGSVDPIQGSLETNINNIANDLEVAGIDWRIAIGGFGASGSGNPRVLTQFTNSVADVQAATGALTSSGSTERGLAAITQATTDVDANYGALREDTGYCVILLTDEDSDYVNGSASDRAAALAGLEAVGAGFIGVVDSSAGTTDLDYEALIAGTVPGAIFDVDDYVNDPTAANNAIISTCIEEILMPEPPQPPEPPVDPKACPNSVFEDGRMYNAALDLVKNECSNKKATCDSVYFHALKGYSEAICDGKQWVPVKKPEPPVADGCPNGVFDNGTMYDSKLNLVSNQCSMKKQVCTSVYFYGLGAYSDAQCTAGGWEPVAKK